MAQLLCPVVVGRDAELAGLVERAEAPRGGAVVLLGEAGVGKSRLLRELAARARERGALVVGGRAVQSAQPAPYRPLAEVLIAACRRRGPPDAPELAPYRAALGRLLPEWHRPDVPVVESTVVLGEGLLRVLDVLGGGAPVLMLLDDLHWADPDTLAVLEYLADHAGEQRLLLVAACRSGAGVVPRVLRELVTRRAATLVELVPLSPADVAEMTRCCLGGDLPAGLDGLLVRAGGLPFLVEELLTTATETGVLVRDRDGWRAGPGDPQVVPRTYVDAVAVRLGALEPADRDVLAVAALLGSRADTALVGAVVGRSPGEVLAALGRCAAVQVVTRDVGGYGFRHALARDAVLAALPEPAGRDLAARARAAVAIAHPGLPDPWGPLAADLALRAGDAGDAASLLLAAARRAVTTGALPTAAAALDRARDLVPPVAGLALDVAELRIEVAALAGDADTAFALGGALVERLVALPQTGGRRARVHLRLADAAAAATRWEDAREQLDAVGPLPLEPADAVRAGATTAHVLLDAGHVAEAERAARSALAAAERLGLAEPACRALEVLGRVARDRNMDEAEAVFERQLRTAHGQGVWALRAMHELGGLDLRRHNDPTRLRAARELAVAAGALSTVATLDLQLAVVAWLALDAQECLAAARRCAEAARRRGMELLLAEALMFELSAHCVAGRRAAMERAEAEIAALGRSEPDLWAAVRARWGIYALLRGDRDRAVGEHDAAVALARTGPRVYVRTYWHMWAFLRTVDGPGGDAARAEVRAVTPAGGLGDALLHYADAVAAGRAGRAGAAEASFACARATVASPGNRGQRHLAERVVAECALADGWGDPVAWLTEAAPFFRGIGQEHLERACRSLLRRAGARVPRREHGHRTVAPELAALGVTDREADVLALVAAGLTTREIAARLYISVRTVDKHVERLLAKTGAARRADLRRPGWVRSAPAADT